MNFPEESAISPASANPSSIDPPGIDPPSADRALNIAVETHTRTELRRQTHKVSANLRELADRIERASESLDQIASGESVTSYADVAAAVQHQVVVTLYNTPLHVLTQLASQADAARALATREDAPS
ncbi:hypothetical protein [Kineococcus rhizosphaerae]|uniref:Uncharacterized protein n=1 Tax=Kineococcus rhizosphaerae TaxID=559628 RepID=A0A2T0QQ00_9ACTN|nr:hypothetical protein [Kineococcus rhizosphaerae]PRY06791.1 hypothetical protein CLV37_1325 [Kineococcus rhizosphaerae]